MLRLLTPLILLILLMPSGCTSSQKAPLAPLPLLPEIGDDVDEDVSPSASRRVLMYLPNRVLDLGDVVHFGLEVGPGIGADAMFTEWLRAGAMKRWSKGMGYQTLRRSPFKSSDEEYAELGPVFFANDIEGVPWVIDPWDIRLEAHLLAVGAHVAVNPAEIFDFFAGWFLVDTRGDDLH